MKDKRARASLARYFDVMQDDKPAKFTIAKKLAADFNGHNSMTELWTLHEKLTREFHLLQKKIDTRGKQLTQLRTPTQSYLDLKIEIANRILANCHLCTHRCGVNRLGGELGYCKCGIQITVSTMFQHMGEEPELVPSGTIFTLGCTLQCRHCQNWSISQWFEKGEIFTPELLAEGVRHLRNDGARNINLVGGDPTPWLQQWLETFRRVDVNVPIVWNSNSYYSEETAKLLTGFADVYLLDFKYGANKCAESISDAQGYWEACTRNHHYGKNYGELLIRVLVLPGHLRCCTKTILNWIAENLAGSIRTNIMFQYRPEWRSHEMPGLKRRLTKDERDLVIRFAREAGLTNFIT
ncbi:MAG: radical SAM protein [Candidatus Bathyarchaeota archaeon]|nr:MAG: radical SAM protein [Candidatus Bathyarchaeota archaeon]